MFKYVTDLLFSEEREEVYDDDEKGPESDSEKERESESEDAGESESEEESEGEGDETDSESGSGESGSEGDPDWCGGHRCVLSCDDLSVLQQFVDSIREQCIARQIAIGGSRDVIRGKRKREEVVSDETKDPSAVVPLTPICDTVPGVGCDPQDPIPCECTKPKEE